MAGRWFLGLHTNNEMFEKHAKYFRNALVRANYQNLDKNIPYTMEYLNKFFGNLLLGEKNRLDNREMQIKENAAKTTQKILDILVKNPSATRAELTSATGLSPDGVK